MEFSNLFTGSYAVYVFVVIAAIALYFYATPESTAFIVRRVSKFGRLLNRHSQQPGSDGTQ